MKSKSKKKPYKAYQESLIKALEDPSEAAAYLNAALEEKDEKMFLVALKNVAEAQGGLNLLRDPEAMEGLRCGEEDIRKGRTISWKELKHQLRRDVHNT